MGKQYHKNLIQPPAKGKVKLAQNKNIPKPTKIPVGVCELDFEPLTLLGNGSFGDVFLVRHKSADKV